MHYIKLLPYLEQYAVNAGAERERWASQLFQDLTHDGERLEICLLPGNDSGPRIALLGRAFCAEAGIDRDRDDAFFISRIQSSDARRVQGVPRPVAAEIRLATSSRLPYPVGDSVRQYFAEAQKAMDPAPRIAPSPRLIKMLREVPIETRRRCRPRPAAPLSTNEVLEALRAAWLRHRLEQFGPGGTRRDVMMLNGAIAPAEVSEDDAASLRALFNVAMLNRVAFARSDQSIELHSLFEAFAQLPIAPDVRALIWAGMLCGLRGDQLRVELHESAPSLSTLSTSVAEEEAFAEAILGALGTVASAHGGVPIRELWELAKTEPRPLQTILDWAGRLEIARENAGAANPAIAVVSVHEVPEVARGSIGGVQLTESVAETVPDAPAEPMVPAKPREHVSPAMQRTFDEWVLSLRVSSVEELQRERRAAAAELQVTVDTLTEPLTLSSAQRTSAALESLRERVQGWVQTLPSAAALEEDERESRAAFDAVADVLSGEVEEVLAARPRPAQLVQVGRFMRHREALDALPDWFWTQSERLGAVRPTLLPKLWQRLLDPILARRANLTTQILTELSSHLRVIDLRRLEEPAPEAVIDEYVEETLRALAEQAQLLDTQREEYRVWVEQALRRGDTAQVVSALLATLERIRGVVAQHVFSGIVSHVAEADEAVARQRRADAYVAAIEVYPVRTKKGSEQASLDALQLLAPEFADDRVPAPDSGVTVEHNYIDAAGERARVHFVAAQDAPYGRIHVPLVLHSRIRRDTVVRLQCEVLSPSTEGWPSDWERPTPTEVNVHRQDWRVHPAGNDTLVFTFAMTIPARPPKTGDRVRVRLSVTTTEGKRTDSFEWPQLKGGPLVLKLDWPDQLNPEFVRDHPIGPQKQHQQIQDRILSGSSFSVIAPRRFGKSTLIEHIRGLHGVDGIVVLPALVCTQFVGGAGIDAEGLWRRVSDHLEAAVGAPLEPALEGGLPRPTAFRAAKALARQKGHSTLVILFDEAQAMFARGNVGHQLGDRFKDAIEFHWAKGSGTEARVVFGLVGLPGLRDRAGANLMDKLRPFDGREIAESDLNKLILKVTGGNLQTTREARLGIAHLSHNLAIAREIVERLVTRARDGGRPWVNYNDVKLVEDELIESLREGREIFVTSLRDVFNTAESVNEWQPGEQFPVAVALAEARAEGLRVEAEICLRAGERLTAWAAETEQDFLQRLTFNAERVAEHVKSLREAGLLKEMYFTSPLVEAWLVGQGRGDPNGTASFRTAMLAAAVSRVRRPTTLEPIGEGGQARVYRFSHDEDVFAYREARLEGDADRQRFSDSLHTLAELAKRVRQREPGSEYVFDLRAVGLRDDDDGFAVQIYRWINGFDLGTRLEQLPPLAVADLGRRLALGLVWLHRWNILHRDIRPRNIVLHAESARPMLIDFGLAKLEGSTMNTQVGNEFAAPEVRSRSPQWSKAADVWSLATTLQRLLTPASRGSDLFKLLQTASVHGAESRPTAETLHGQLERESARLQVTETNRALFEKRVREPAQADSAVAFYGNIIQKFRPRFEATFTGLHPTAIARATEAADFLNQLLEAWKPRTSAGTAFSLGQAKHQNDVTGNDLNVRCIDFVHRLRSFRSHGTGKSSRVMMDFGNPDDRAISQLARDAALKIGKATGIVSLGVVVDAFLVTV